MSQEELRVQNYLDRPGRYANIDGVNELTWGAILCGLALSDWLSANTSKSSLWHERWVQLAYVPAMLLLIHFARKALKTSVTYPRTGFVSYPETVRTRMAPLVAAAIAIAAAFAAAQAVRGGLRLTTLLGAVNAVFYAVAAHPVRSWKWGFVLAIAAGSLWIQDGQALVFFGTAFLASGITTLVLYLRTTRTQ